MAFEKFRGGVNDPNAPDNLAQHSASHGWSNWIAASVSLIALAFSGYSLWETSLRRADIAMFVPPVIHFASPYTNTNFEVIQLPVTLTNDGARTGTVVAINLKITDPRTNASKLFYAADMGRWTMDKVRDGTLKPFAPLSIAGQSSRTETVLFYTRGDEQTPPRMIYEKGVYEFELSPVMAEADAGPSVFDRFNAQRPASLRFQRKLVNYDARAFNTGTLPLYAPDWSASHNAD